MFSTVEIKKSVVAILDAHDKRVGAGFVTRDVNGIDLIITCAHVIAAAGVKAGDDVRIQFEVPPVIRNCVVCDPSEHSRKTEDIAILQLTDVLPEGVFPLAIGTSQGTMGHDFITYGYPVLKDINQHPGSGEIVDEYYIAEVPHVLLKSSQVVKGFSGAPVWDLKTRRVVGMISSIYKANLTSIPTGTIAIPSEALKNAWKDLECSDICPYQGLGFFDEENAEFFFGRQDILDELLHILNGSPSLLIIAGPSGCGKSSLVRAGLIPALRAGKIPDSQNWGIFVGRPADQRFIQPASAGLMITNDDLVSSVDKWLIEHPAQTRLVIIIDQLEDLFTSYSAEDQEKFINQVGLVSNSEKRVSVILIIQSRFQSLFLNLAANSDEIGGIISSNIDNKHKLKPREIDEIIRKPAECLGLSFEPSSLPQLIQDKIRTHSVGEVQASILPLLEFTLTQMWNQMWWGDQVGEVRQEGRRDRILSIEDYFKTGGVFGSLTQKAENAYRSLKSKEEKRLAERLFVDLIRPGVETEGTPDIRRQMRLDAHSMSIDENKQMLSVIQHFVKFEYRLLVTYQDEKNNVDKVEIIHDVVVQEWERLRDWINNRRPLLVWQQEYRARIQEWKNSDPETRHRDQRMLLSDDIQLALAKDLHRNYLEDLWREERDFIEESVRIDTLKRQRKIGAIFLGILVSLITTVVILVSIAVAINRSFAVRNETSLRLTAEVNEKTAVSVRATSESSKATAESSQATAVTNEGASEISKLAESELPNHFDLALLLSIEAYKLANTIQTQSTLFKVAYYKPELEHIIQGGLYPFGYRLLPDRRLYYCTWEGLHFLDPNLLNENISTEVCEGDLTQLPNGQIASIVMDGENLRVVSYDVESTASKVLLQSQGDFEDLWAWSQDGRLAVVECESRGEYSRCTQAEIVIWDIGNQIQFNTLKNQNAVIAMAWSGDGRLAIGTTDGTIVWDPQNNTITGPFIYNNQEIYSLSWSSDGLLATGMGEGDVFIWNREFNEPSTFLESVNTNDTTGLSWSSDGRLASALRNGTIIIWDVNRGTIQKTLFSNVGEQRVNNVKINWAEDGTLVAEYDDGEIILWEPDREDFRLKRFGLHQINSLAFSEDGMLAAGMEDGTVLIWDKSSLLPLRTMVGHSDAVQSVAWSSDNRLASGSCSKPVPNSSICNQGEIIIWDTKTGLPLQTLIDHPGRVKTLAFSPDGLLASGSGSDDSWDTYEERTLLIWDLSNGVSSRSLILGRSSYPVSSLAWSPQGDLATLLGDLFVWDKASFEPSQPIYGSGSNGTSVAWSTDGKLATASLEKIVVWDLENNMPPITLQTNNTRSIAWSPSGQLASGSFDGKVIIWDIASGGAVITMDDHPLEVDLGITSVAWSKDGRLAYGNFDGEIVIVEMNPEIWVKEACERAGRNLSQDEWSQYFPNESYRRTCPQWKDGE